MLIYINKCYQANMNRKQNFVIDYFRGVSQNIVQYFHPELE